MDLPTRNGSGDGYTSLQSWDSSNTRVSCPVRQRVGQAETVSVAVNGTQAGTTEDGVTTMRSDHDRDPVRDDPTESGDAPVSRRPAQWLPPVDPEPDPAESTAPPVDIDDRESTRSHADPPEVIELPDHAHPADTAERDITTDEDFPEYDPDEATEAAPDAPMEDLQEEWESDTYIDPETTDTSRDDDGPVDADVSTRMISADTTEPGVLAGGHIVRDTEGIGRTPLRTDVLRAEQVDHSTAGDRLVHETVISESGRDNDRIDQDGEEPFAADLRQHVPESVRRFLAPSLTFHWTTKHRLVVIGGGLLVLLALLANSAGTALIVASGIVAILLALTLPRQDLFERESPALIMAVGVIGGVIGIVIGTVTSWLTSGNWFDSGTLNYGAAGFGGRFADLGGAAPLSVWLLNGLILPLIALAGIAAAPVALRRLPQFRNEVMDGVILIGSSAAGFTIGTALVYWSPMLGNRGPQTDVSDWTLTMIGVVILRPVVITLAGAMLGAGIWRYMVTPSIVRILLPAVGSVGAFLLLTFGSIQLQPAGLWPEVIWTLLLAAATFAIYRVVLKGAITEDRKAMGSDGGRMVCPGCQQITPTGAFCANCGEPLSDAAGTGRVTSAPGST